MNKVNKKTSFFTKLTVAILTLTLLFALSACGKDKPNSSTPDGVVTITVVLDMSSYEGNITTDEGVTGYVDNRKMLTLNTEKAFLIGVLDELSEKKMLTYSADASGFLKMFDNISLTGNSFFGIYTDDGDNSNTDWGSYPLFGNDLGSASVGAKDLPIKDGKTYVIAASTF